MNAERNLDTLRFLHQAHAEQLLTSDEFSQYKQAVLAGCEAVLASSAPSAPLAPALGNVLLAQAELLRSVSDAVHRYYQTIAPENATPANRTSPSSTEQSASLFFAEPCSEGSSCSRTIRRPNEDPLNRTMNPQLDPLQIDVSRLFRPQAPAEAPPVRTAPAASRRRRGVTTHDRAPALAAALCAVEEDLSPD